MTNKFVFFSLLISLACNTFAIETAPTVAEPKPLETQPKIVEDVSAALKQTRDRRAEAQYYVLGNYAPFDLIIPSKYGFTLGLIQGIDSSWELEYLHGGISVPFVIKDLGKMSDDRFSLIKRSYLGNNSFNISYGLSYHDFSIHLGDKLLNNLTGGNYPSIDLIQIQSIGLNAGVGNRWSFDHNITVGIDWISWSQPLVITKKQNSFSDYATNQEDRDNVETAVKWISYLPRFSVVKLQVGILF